MSYIWIEGVLRFDILKDHSNNNGWVNKATLIHPFTSMQHRDNEYLCVCLDLKATYISTAWYQSVATNTLFIYIIMVTLLDLN